MQDHDDGRSRNNNARSSSARVSVVVGGLLALLLTLGHPAVARADVEEMVLRIDGLAAPVLSTGPRGPHRGARGAHRSIKTF